MCADQPQAGVPGAPRGYSPSVSTVTPRRGNPGLGSEENARMCASWNAVDVLLIGVDKGANVCVEGAEIGGITRTHGRPPFATNRRTAAENCARAARRRE
jgi:hypothetical protein